MRIMAMPVDKGGCGHYRVRQPLALIKELTPHDTYVVEKDSDEIESVLQYLPTVDIFVVRQGIKIGETKRKFESMMEELSKEIKKDLRLKAKWVMDIDDNMELISPYSEHYRESGIENYFDPGINKWIWVDGENGFDIERNKDKLKSSIRSLMEADLVTVSTNKLADYARQYNKNVVVLPNSINFDKWWKLDLKPNKQLRVGWSGGISHYEDWYTIKEPLNKLLRQFKFKLIICGDYFKGIVDDDLKYLVEHHPWVDFSGHSYRMMCMGLDLAIIPLDDKPFNHFKSSIKWFEMSAMKVPSIVADIGPYSNVIHHKDVAWTYNNATSFEKAVFEALHNYHLRREYAQNAYDWVSNYRNAKINTKLWVDAYQKLIDGVY